MNLASDLFDLHVHSIHSDGLYSPMPLADLARRGGLAGLAITDHDVLSDPTLIGDNGLRWIAGVELSTIWRDRSLHLLGFGFDPSSPELRSLCDQLQRARRARLEGFLESLAKSGIRIDSERANALRRLRSPGRLHLARELVRMRRAPTNRSAIERYLNPVPPTAFDRPSVLDAIAHVQNAGGLAVLAHPPCWLKGEDWTAFTEAGLDGLETQFGRVQRKRTRNLDAIAREKGWLVTAGSDFHGDRPGEYLGRFHVDGRTCRLCQPARHPAAVAEAVVD